MDFQEESVLRLWVYLVMNMIEECEWKFDQFDCLVSDGVLD